MGKPIYLVLDTLDLLILRTLALEPMHGRAISQRIRHVSIQRKFCRFSKARRSRRLPCGTNDQKVYAGGAMPFSRKYTSTCAR